MDKVLKVKVKNVFGKNLIYPVNQEAKIFARLVGKKTLDEVDLKLTVMLGYDIKVVNDTVIDLTKVTVEPII